MRGPAERFERETGRRLDDIGPDSAIDPAEQLAYYDAGLGSLPPSGGMFKAAFRTAHNFLSQATGFGLTTNIIDCHESFIRLSRLRPVEIHREFMTAAARWMMALKLLSVLSARMAIRLNSLSLQKKFSMR